MAVTAVRQTKALVDQRVRVVAETPDGSLFSLSLAGTAVGSQRLVRARVLTPDGPAGMLTSDVRVGSLGDLSPYEPSIGDTAWRDTVENQAPPAVVTPSEGDAAVVPRGVLLARSGQAWVPVTVLGNRARPVRALVDAVAAPGLPAVPDLALRLNGDNITSSVGTTGFSGWASLVGTGPAFTQGVVTRQPTVVDAPDGGKALLFDGGDVLGGSSGTNATLGRNVPGLTIIAVHRPDSAAAFENRAVVILSRGTSLAYRMGLYQNPSGAAGLAVRRLDEDATTIADATTPMPVGRWCVHSGVADYAAGKITNYLGGAAVATAALPGAGNSSDTDSLGVGIGGLTGNNANLYRGAIAAILVYKRALTTTERQAVEGYLARRYNVATVTPTPTPAAAGYGANYGTNYGG